MPSKADFARDIRNIAGALKELAANVGNVTGLTHLQRDEAAEFLREACEDCEDAIRAVGEKP